MGLWLVLFQVWMPIRVRIRVLLGMHTTALRLIWVVLGLLLVLSMPLVELLASDVLSRSTGCATNTHAPSYERMTEQAC